MTRARQRRLRAEDPQAAEGRGHRQGRRAAGPRRARRLRRPLPVAALRRPAPADGARPRARGRAAACCCSTSRSARSTPTSAPSCARGCGGCTTRSTSRRCSSRTTRRRRWRSPTGSCVLRRRHGSSRSALAARALRPARPTTFVMGFLGPGLDACAASSCARTTSRSARRPEDGGERGDGPARRAPRLRGARGARALATARRSRRSSRAPRPTRSSPRPGSIVWLRPQRPGGQRLIHASGSSPSRLISSGSSPGREVGERDVLDDRAQAGAHGDPDLLQGLGGAGVLDVLGRLAADAGQRALDGADDVGER